MGNVTKSGVTYNGESVVLGAGNIGSGAIYTIGQNAGGSITQSYIAFDGEYGFGDYIAFDFTGKNMPEVMFFANNYNESMYYEAGKQGVVVASGITLWDGTIGSAQSNNTKVGVSGPFGAYFESAAAPYGGNMLSDFAAQLARANLVDGTQYRVIMGFVNNGTTFTLNYNLYNLTTGETVEEVSQTSWAFFTGSNTAVNSMTLDGLSGSIVLYGKFNATCTLDKVHGVFEDTDIATVAAGLNGSGSYTVQFKDEAGNVLQETQMPFGTMPAYDGELPEKADDFWYDNYVASWDKPMSLVTGDTVYTLTYVGTARSENVTENGDGVILGSGSIGAGANYTIGQNAGGSITQSYYAFNGDYAFNDYIALDFTGKNMPEVMFFAKNYDTSMYYS